MKNHSKLGSSGYGSCGLRAEPLDNNLEEAGMALHNFYLHQILDRLLPSSGLWQQYKARLCFL